MPSVERLTSTEFAVVSVKQSNKVGRVAGQLSNNSAKARGIGSDDGAITRALPQCRCTYKEIVLNRLRARAHGGGD